MHRLLTLVLVLLFSAGATAAQTLNFCATLDGSQEVPPAATPATGTAALTFDTVTKMLSLTVTYAGLTAPETGAHIHGPANPGQNAGVIFVLTPGSPINAVVGPLSAAQEGYLTGGQMYFNVHTSNFPGGEIRGQITSCPVPVENSSWGAVKTIYR
jgi:hypothetical protein